MSRGVCFMLAVLLLAAWAAGVFVYAASSIIYILLVLSIAFFLIGAFKPSMEDSIDEDDECY